MNLLSNSLHTSEKKAQFWLAQSDLDENAKKDIQQMLASKDSGHPTELVEAFCQELSFGTAGLRGLVGTGSNKLNVYNARKVAQALSTSLLESNLGKNTVLLSCDSRLSSNAILLACAEVLKANGIEVFAFEVPTPTPLLSFAIRQLNAQSGLMITASHNPKDYNGIKVYGSDGAQVTAPLDDSIMKHYQLLEKNWSLIKRKNLTITEIPLINKSIFESYFQCLEAECLQPTLIKAQGPNLKFVYTPLHGTGAYLFAPLMKQLGFTNFSIVQSQEKPDGHFPTAPKPNPEEPEALALASELMLKTNSEFAIGNDPDADRMGIIANDQGKPYFLSGNEINNLMLHYKLDQLQKMGSLPAHSIVLRSLVSSPMQDKICEHYGIKIFTTLTGFKWMAKKLHDLDTSKTPYSFIFASEESYGSMSHKHVRDKDGLSSAALFAELVLWHKSQGRNLKAAIDFLAQTFGYYHDQVFSFNLPGIAGMDSISKIMQHCRDLNFCKMLFMGDSDPAVEIVDYQTGAEGLPPSNLVKIIFHSHATLFVRPSGTEPKIKFYVALRDNSQKSLPEKKSFLESQSKRLQINLGQFIAKI
jgi:phosphoglucomutase